MKTFCPLGVAAIFDSVAKLYSRTATFSTKDDSIYEKCLAGNTNGVTVCVTGSAEQTDAWVASGSTKNRKDKGLVNADTLYAASVYDQNLKYAQGKGIALRIKGHAGVKLERDIEYDDRGILSIELTGGRYMLLKKARGKKDMIALAYQLSCDAASFLPARGKFEFHIPQVQIEEENDLLANHTVGATCVVWDGNTDHRYYVEGATQQNIFAIGLNGVKAKSVTKMQLTKGIGVRPNPKRVIVIDSSFVVGIFRNNDAMPEFVAYCPTSTWIK